jgi:hypothetical protein
MGYNIIIDTRKGCLMKFKTLEKQYLAATEKRKRAARQMRESGLTWKQIGMALGVTYQRAQQLAKKIDKNLITD